MSRDAAPSRDLRYRSRGVHASAIHTPSTSDESDPSGPELSVVVATTDAADSLAACLSALGVATTDIAAEIVVVDAARGARQSPTVPAPRTITAPPGTLVPMLWLRGLQSSRGRFVAFTIAQCVVSPTWAERMIAGMTEGVGGAGGALALGSGTRPHAWALYFLRYSNFLEERWRPGPVVGDIAGDNAIYRRSDLLAPGVCPSAGFWEVDVHRRLRQRGLTLVAVADAAATLIGAPAPRHIVRERFRHGRHFGAWRARSAARRVRTVLAAPLVPLVLLGRIARRIWPFPNHRLRFIAALPWLLVFVTAWAVGEAAGAFRGAVEADA